MRRLTSLMAVAALVACGGAGEDDASPTADAPIAAVTLTPSDIAVPKQTDITAGVAISGSLEPSQTVMVSAEVGGRMRRVLVDRGSRVSRGQLLAQIEAEGVTSQAAGAQAAVISAEATEQLAQQRLEAARRLNAAGAISDIELKTAETNLRAATAQLALARSQLVAANEASGRTSVTSPIAGIVNVRNVEQGEAVRDGDELFQIVDVNTLELQAQVSVDDAMRVKVGAPVSFTIEALGQTLEGRVARIAPRADPGTRQVAIAAQLSNPGGRIVAGQFTRGRVVTGQAVPGLAIPIAAVRDSAGTAFVFVIENGKLVQRQVTLGARDDAQGLVLVTEGLSATDRILARQVVGAANGLQVNVASDSATRAPAPASGEK